MPIQVNFINYKSKVKKNWIVEFFSVESLEIKEILEHIKKIPTLSDVECIKYCNEHGIGWEKIESLEEKVIKILNKIIKPEYLISDISPSVKTTEIDNSK